LPSSLPLDFAMETNIMVFLDPCGSYVQSSIAALSVIPRRRCRKKTGAGDSLFARLSNTTTMPTLMKILL